MKCGDNLAIVRAILCKTVARGATVGEEASAVAKAVELMGKHAIPHSAVASVWPKGWDFHGKRAAEKRMSPKEFVDAYGGLDPQGFVDLVNRHFNKADRARAEKAYRPTSTGSIGDYARQLLLRTIGGQPYSYVWIIESVQLRFPHAKTSVSSLRWYENEMRKQGREVPTKRPAK